MVVTLPVEVGVGDRVKSEEELELRLLLVLAAEEDEESPSLVLARTVLVVLESTPDDEVVAESELDEVREVLEEDRDVVIGAAGVVDELVDDWVLVDGMSGARVVEDVVPVVVVDVREAIEELEGVVEMTGCEDEEELCATDEEDDEERLCETDDEDEDDVEAEEEEDKVSLVLVVVVATVLLGVGSVVMLIVEDEEEEVPISEKFARVEIAVGGLRECRDCVEDRRKGMPVSRLFF